MEQFPIQQVDTEFRIDGFPDGVKVISLKGPRARRLSDLMLHKRDLRFAAGCLLAINSISDGPPILREALCRSAIVSFVKWVPLRKV
jgi:hypothetical protein